jgi:hypothetical protein
MTRRAHRLFAARSACPSIAAASAIAIALVGSAATLAAGAARGKTYEGGVPTTGIDLEGHRVRTHAIGKIVLRVAASGRSVTVRFSSSAPVLYCVTPQRLHVQSTKPARISSSGNFTATVAQRFAAGPGAPAIVQVVKGRFSGGTVRGTIHTQAGECGGSGAFSATAR